MKHRRLFGLLLIATIGIFGLSSCQAAKQDKPDFSSYKTIADLAAIECYYHNVAEIYNPGDDYLFGALHVGYKKAWFEFRGSVNLGVDVNKVTISEPDENNVVTIGVPPTQVLGTPKIDEESFSEVISDKSLFTPITNEEKTNALTTAQNSMREEAEHDERLMLQANLRVRTLLEQYVIDVGKTIGKDYTVKFVEAQ